MRPVRRPCSSAIQGIRDGRRTGPDARHQLSRRDRRHPGRVPSAARGRPHHHGEFRTGLPGRRPRPCRLFGDQVGDREVHHGRRAGPRAPGHHGQCRGGRTDGERNGTAGPRKALVSSLSLQRMGHPDEIALAITFLASPAASYVTGAVLDAHGGYNA
nr:SDR family oxidoreductase [Microbispora rosea]